MDQDTAGHTRSADGTPVAWERMGQGPVLLVIHGGARMGKHYRALATALADRFTVILMDRRGRGRSGPGNRLDGMGVEVADVSAVMQATGATLLFGHSAGALIALEAARVVPVERLAVYDPPVSMESLLPMDWFAPFERALAEGRPARAMALFVRGLHMGPPQWLPHWVVTLALSLLMQTPDGLEMATLLQTLPRDILSGRALGSDLKRYQAVHCPTLLMAGGKSPAFLRAGAALLKQTLPNVRAVDLPLEGHNAPDQNAPQAVARLVADFFAPAVAGS